MKKLNNNQGASIIIALLYFLICAMVGSVILGAALANASRIKAEHQNENNYLAVRSAGELLKSKIMGINGLSMWHDPFVEPDEDNPQNGGEWSTEEADSGDIVGFKESFTKLIEDDKNIDYLQQEIVRSIYACYLSNVTNDNRFVDLHNISSESKEEKRTILLQLDTDSDEQYGSLKAPVIATVSITPNNVALDSDYYQEVDFRVNIKLQMDTSSTEHISGNSFLVLNLGTKVIYSLQEYSYETEPDSGGDGGDENQDESENTEPITYYAYRSNVNISFSNPLFEKGLGNGE